MKNNVVSVFAVLLLLQATALASVKLPTRSLELRVAEAELVFVGKLTNKQVEGDWVKAELIVERPIAGVKVKEKVAVTWRATIGGRAIYDAAEGQRGVALLKDKHEGRYWLRGDKFEDLKQGRKIAGLRKAAEVKKRS